MVLPAVHRRPGQLMNHPFPPLGWGKQTANEFDELFERMNHFLEAVGAEPTTGAWSPLADMHETDDSYVVEAELPGIEREDIDVEISNRELRISGEYKEREREESCATAHDASGTSRCRLCFPRASRQTRSPRPCPTESSPSRCPKPRRPRHTTWKSPRPDRPV